MGLILVDSSVWIDRLRDRQTLQTIKFAELVDAEEDVAVGDLMLTEILQGFSGDRAARTFYNSLSAYPFITIVDRNVAIEAARNYRHLRSLGITIRKTIDTLIATRCILDRIPLLYSDRDYDPFVQHLGLKSALHLPKVT